MRAATPTVSLFCFFSFPRTRFAFSGAARWLVQFSRASPRTSRPEARAASHARGKHLSRSRAVLRRSDSGTVRVRWWWWCHSGSLRDGPGDETPPGMLWEIAFKMKRGFFPCESRVFVVAFFSFIETVSVCFVFRFPPGKRHRPEPTSLLCSVSLFYTRQWWWWSGGMDIALFPCISTLRGMLLLLPTLSLC